MRRSPASPVDGRVRAAEFANFYLIGSERMQVASIHTFRDGVEAAARSRLEQVGYRSLRGISCRFRAGTLYLYGRVPSYYMKQLAQESLQSMERVRRVVNQVEVRW